MDLKKLKSLTLKSLVIVGAGAILVSCTCKIKDEQLSKLAELRRQERALSSDLTAQQSARTRLNSELTARTAEVNDCNGKLEIVKQRLAAWPNIWPDWTPAP